MEKVKKYTTKKYTNKEKFFAIILLGIVLSISSASTIYLYWLIEQFIALRTTNLFRHLDLPTVSVMLLVYFIVNVFVSFILLMLITKYVIQPIYLISEASGKVAKGDYTVEIQKRKRNFKFINRTIDNFNLMTKHLKSVEMLQNDFISNVSHEIKTPLSAIDGYARLVENSPNLTKEEKGYIGKIIEHSKHLTGLVEDILALTKFENHQIADSKKWFRLDEQIRKAILFLAPKIRNKNLHVDINMQAININANPTMFYHVWYNLISNAVKFSQNNAEISICAEINDNDIEVKIKDHGVGMDEKTIGHIYEKFYQAPSTQHYGGNGLGLSLVKRIVDIYGGKIEVESKLGEGSCFTVKLKQND